MTWQFCIMGLLHKLSVDTAAGPLEQPPGQLTVSQVTDADKEALCSACCAAPAALLLVTAFLLYVCFPSVLTTFVYSALVPAVSLYPQARQHPRLCYCIFLCQATYCLLCRTIISGFVTSHFLTVCCVTTTFLLAYWWLILNSGDQ